MCFRRLCYIHSQRVLPSYERESLLKYTIAVGGVLLSVFFATGHLLEYVHKGLNCSHAYNYCMKLPQFVHSKHSMPIQWTTWASMLMWTMLELCMYVWIFKSMFRYQNKASVSVFRNNPQKAKLRQKKNTITATGHFVSWLTQVLLFLLNIAIHDVEHKNGHHSHMHEYENHQPFAQANVTIGEQDHHSEHHLSHPSFCFLFLMPSINFVVFPTVQTLTSAQLRAHLKYQIFGIQ